MEMQQACVMRLRIEPMTKPAKKPTSVTPHSSSTSELDQKALKILIQYERNWRRQWCSTETTPAPSAEDVRYAQRAGYMFAPRALTHDDLVAWLRKSFALVKKNEVTDAFIASLSTRRLEWRSALGSFAVARSFPNHHFRKAGPGEVEYRDYCTVCEFMGGPKSRASIDLNLMNCTRMTRGGGSWNQAQPDYPAFDLDLFAKMAKPKPTEADFTIMKQIISSIRQLPAKARLADLQKEIGKHLPSNQFERQTLIEILGFCSILETPDHPGFLRTFTPFIDRGYATLRGDWAYPVEFWRGRHGINEKALRFWFGRYKKLGF